MAEQYIQTYSKELKEFDDFIKTKNDLPQNIEKLLLLRFLHCCDNDVEKAEKMLRKNLKMRKKCPTLFKNRDILSETISYGKFVHQAAPWKPVRVHAVNCPAIVKRFMAFVGPRVRRDYMELMHFHDNFDILDEAIPKELLPNEFGGSAGCIDDIHDSWTKFMENKRDYILNDDNWKIGDK